MTTTTLTYEAAPGINRTVQLILIDVPATERANNELPGDFQTRRPQRVSFFTGAVVILGTHSAL